MLDSRALSLLVAAPLLALLSGCASTHGSSAKNVANPGQASTTTLTAGEMPAEQTTELPPMVAVADAAPKASDGEARLIVDRAIVLRCPNLQMMADQPFDGSPAEAWLAVLNGVAGCINHGDLGASNLRVTGSARAANTVGYVLSRMGVDVARLEAVDDFEEDLCAHDRRCAVTTVRLDLADSKDEGTHI